jgi:hypothetical protein
MTEEHFPAFRSGVLSEIQYSSVWIWCQKRRMDVPEILLYLTTILGPQMPAGDGHLCPHNSLNLPPCNLMEFSSNRLHDYFWLCDRTFSITVVICQWLFARAACHSAPLAATFGSRLLSSLFFKSLVTWSFNIKTTP